MRPNYSIDGFGFVFIIIGVTTHTVKKDQRDARRRERRATNDGQRELNLGVEDLSLSTPSPKQLHKKKDKSAQAETVETDFKDFLKGKHAVTALNAFKMIGEVWPGIVVVFGILWWGATHKLWVFNGGLVGIPVAVFLILRRKAARKSVVFGFTVLSVLAAAALFVSFGTPEPEDTLLPSNEPNPMATGGFANTIDPRRVYLFTAASAYMIGGTNLVSIISYNGETMLGLQWSPKGASLSGQFFSQNGEIIAVVEKNRIITNAGNIFRMKKNRHSLVIHDQRNIEIINLRFINPYAFTFTGTIRLPDGRVVGFSKESLTVNGLPLTENLSIAMAAREGGSIFESFGPPRK